LATPVPPHNGKKAKRKRYLVLGLKILGVLFLVDSNRTLLEQFLWLTSAQRVNYGSFFIYAWIMQGGWLVLWWCLRSLGETPIPRPLSAFTWFRFVLALVTMGILLVITPLLALAMQQML
jgi:hypothetical protein